MRLPLRVLSRLLCAFALGVALLVGILVANTLRIPAPPPPSRAAPPAPVIAAAVIAEHLAAAIRIETISHEDGALDDPAALARLRSLLEATYPRVHRALERESLAAGALLYTWKGRDPSLRPVLFAAHQDVVPIEPGTEASWTEPPFSGRIAGGFVWGRGALDDKGSLIGLLEAAESLLAEGFAPRRTILLAFGADEEVGGRGALAIAAALQARGTRVEYALDEGLAVTEGVVPGVALPVAVVGLGEKGFVTVELAIEVPGGHSSMPPPETAIGILAAAVDRVARAPLPARMTEAARRSLAVLAPYLPFGQRLAVANLWLLEPLVVASLTRKPLTNATVRTTTAPTIFQAGIKGNVLPSHARAAVNFRVLPGDTIEGVVAHVRRVVADPRVSVEVMPTLGGDPLPLASVDTRAYRLLEQTLQRFYPGAVVAPGLVLAATDARHYTGVADAVYHFAPFVFRAGDRERIHGTNERAALADLEVAVGVYRDLMKDGEAR